MTWADRISFVLDETLNLKRIAPLDVLKEGDSAISTMLNDHERMDSDLALFSMEFGKLMVELIDALGGEKRI
ncbi:recombination associated protein [compost metagenome]